MKSGLAKRPPNCQNPLSKTALSCLQKTYGWFGNLVQTSFFVITYRGPLITGKRHVEVGMRRGNAHP